MWWNALNIFLCNPCHLCFSACREWPCFIFVRCHSLSYIECLLMMSFKDSLNVCLSGNFTYNVWLMFYKYIWCVWRCEHHTLESHCQHTWEECVKDEVMLIVKCLNWASAFRDDKPLMRICREPEGLRLC